MSMSHEYLPTWKAARGYYETLPAFRWLSDEECDWWEEKRSEWQMTRPGWTSERSSDVIRRLLGLLPPAPKSKVDKDEVKARVDMLDLVGSYGAKMRSFGRRASGRCPLHEDRLASFSVDLDRKLWHCFSGCGGGDCFSLVMRQEDVTFGESVRILNERY